MNQQMQSKGGWIASFMIIGAVLVLGLLAGLYYVKTRQIEESTQPIATESQETSKPAEQKPQMTEDKNKAPSQSSTDDTKNDAKSIDKQAPVEEPGDKTTVSNPDSESNDQKVESDSKELPTTGPADVGAQFIALAALAVSGAAYVQSRRGL